MFIYIMELNIIDNGWKGRILFINISSLENCSIYFDIGMNRKCTSEFLLA